MANLKIERWLGFATRLVSVMEITQDRKQKLIREIKSFIAIYEVENREILGWDTTRSNGDMSVGDMFDDHFSDYETWNEKLGKYTGKFHNQLACAIRSGIDVVTCEFGGGVLGFDFGDLQTMYAGNIPDWVSEAMQFTGEEKSTDMLWL